MKQSPCPQVSLCDCIVKEEAQATKEPSQVTNPLLTQDIIQFIFIVQVTSNLFLSWHVIFQKLSDASTSTLSSSQCLTFKNVVLLFTLTTLKGYTYTLLALLLIMIYTIFIL